MVGSSPAGGPGPRLALPPAEATPEEPEGAADRPGPPSAPPCCCCSHLGPGKRSLVHKQPGERTPPAVGQPPNATAEEKKSEEFTIIPRASSHLSAILCTFLCFNTLSMPVMPFLNLSQIRGILFTFLMFPETATCEKLTWVTPATEQPAASTANSRADHGIPHIPWNKRGTKSRCYIQQSINPV